MRVGIFYSSISNIHKALHKQHLMDNFKQGVVLSGDEAIDFKSRTQVIQGLDAGFVLGYTLENNYRKKIIDTLKIIKAKIIFVDSNIFSYGDNYHQYHRYSVNSIYPTDGEYFLGENFSPDKLNRILTYHRIRIKPWRSTGNHILLLGQRTMSWNMLNRNGLEWIIGQVTRIKQHTDRKIVIRLHPGDKTYDLENRRRLSSIFFGSNVVVSNNPHITQDLTDAWCSVGYNSTSNCVSAIEGVPVFLDDPLNSWARDVSFSKLHLIEDPPMPDREKWLEKIANIHWNNDEIMTGVYWRRLKSFYKI
ncbi:MAG: hypothetical protein EBT86_00600 [Actinobacteria bacterium]|nr:hypothetical protein [Actinomycetota bacterium]